MLDEDITRVRDQKGRRETWKAQEELDPEDSDMSCGSEPQLSTQEAEEIRRRSAERKHTPAKRKRSRSGDSADGDDEWAKSSCASETTCQLGKPHGELS